MHLITLGCYLVWFLYLQSQKSCNFQFLPVLSQDFVSRCITLMPLIWLADFWLSWFWWDSVWNRNKLCLKQLCILLPRALRAAQVHHCTNQPLAECGARAVQTSGEWRMWNLDFGQITKRIISLNFLTDYSPLYFQQKNAVSEFSHPFPKSFSYISANPVRKICCASVIALSLWFCWQWGAMHWLSCF